MEPARCDLYLIDHGYFFRVKIGSFYPTAPLPTGARDAIISVTGLNAFLESEQYSPLQVSEKLNLYAMLNGYSCVHELGTIEHYWKGGPKDPQADLDLGEVYRHKGRWEWAPTAPKETYKMPDAASAAALGLRPPPDPKPRPVAPLTSAFPSLRKADMIEVPIELVSGLLMMLGGGVRLTWADLVAAEKIRNGRRIVWSMSRDPAQYRINIEE